MNIPDKWAIKNCPEVGEWFNKQLSKECNSYISSFDSFLHSYNHDEIHIISKTQEYKAFSYFRGTGEKPDEGYTEITLEQFRQYISKVEKVSEPKDDMKYLVSFFKKLGIK